MSAIARSEAGIAARRPNRTRYRGLTAQFSSVHQRERENNCGQDGDGSEITRDRGPDVKPQEPTPQGYAEAEFPFEFLTSVREKVETGIRKPLVNRLPIARWSSAGFLCALHGAFGNFDL